MTLTRTEAVLKIHTHMTRDEILEHLTSNRSLDAKRDALLFQSIVKKTGGENTPWAKAVKRAAANDADPLRRRHVEIMAQRRTDLQAAIRDILAQPDMKPRERNRQLAAAAERLAPASFVSWAAAERNALEQEWEARQRVAEQRNERAETQKREAERAQTKARTAPPRGTREEEEPRDAAVKKDTPPFSVLLFPGSSQLIANCRANFVNSAPNFVDRRLELKRRRDRNEFVLRNRLHGELLARVSE